MKQISGKLAAIMMIGVLVSSVGATPAFADWDKTDYPKIKGTIPDAKSWSYSKISLAEAMEIAENSVPESKAIYGKLQVTNGYVVYKVVMMSDDRAYSKVLVDAGNGNVLYESEPITKYSYKNKRNHSVNNHDKKHEKRMNEYFKGMTPEQIAEKKQQFKEMGDAWKSLSIQDRAAMIIHFMQMKMQWDTMSDEQKDLKKQEMKEQWKEFLPLSPEEKKQKLEDYVKSLN